ncbi:Sugar phosphate isomerase/epimerase OS=Streptomyces violarus OX=67380 GN=FHS41_003764 PE=4 SV=1 [Streptomyces violarus]
MKLAFSTLGVPGLPLPDVLRLATAHGYHGVDCAAHPEEPVHPGLGSAEQADVAAEFKGSGVEILGLAGYARVAAPGDDEPVLAEIRSLLDLARDLGAPYIRVFPGGDLDVQTPEEADATAAQQLGTAADNSEAEPGRAHPPGDPRLAPHRRRRDARPRAGRPPPGGRAVGRDAHLAGRRTALGAPAALYPHLGYVQVKDIASAEDTTRCRSAPVSCRWPSAWRSSPGTAGTAGCAGSTRSAGTSRLPNCPAC